MSGLIKVSNLEGTLNSLAESFKSDEFNEILDKWGRDWESRYLDIPFGNSFYQELTFVLGAQVTPARAYRQLGLRLSEALQALKVNKIALKRTDVEIKILQKSLKQTEDTLERELILLDIEEKESNRVFQNKLIKDSLAQVIMLKQIEKSFTKYSREEFEKEEEAHFRITQDRMALGMVGAKESILNMTKDVDGILNKTINEIAFDHETHVSALLANKDTKLLEG